MTEAQEKEFIARVYRVRPTHPNKRYVPIGDKRFNTKRIPKNAWGYNWNDADLGELFQCYGDPTDTEHIFLVQPCNLVDG